METTIDKNPELPKFRIEKSKDDKSVRIWGDKQSMKELHDIFGECLPYINDDREQSSQTVLSLSLANLRSELRHAFMGERLTMLDDGIIVNEWTDELRQLYEEDNNRFQVGVEFSWTHILLYLFPMWECLKNKNCPTRLKAVQSDIATKLEELL